MKSRFYKSNMFWRCKEIDLHSLPTFRHHAIAYMKDTLGMTFDEIATEYNKHIKLSGARPYYRVNLHDIEQDYNNIHYARQILMKWLENKRFRDQIAIMR